jgi:hypothetical protein
VSNGDDDVARQFRDMMGRRQSVDQEPGMLLIWVTAAPEEVADLMARVEARHPGARFTVQNSGSATAVQITARDEELTAIEALYISRHVAEDPAAGRSTGAGA